MVAPRFGEAGFDIGVQTQVSLGLWTRWYCTLSPVVSRSSKRSPWCHIHNFEHSLPLYGAVSLPAIGRTSHSLLRAGLPPPPSPPHPGEAGCFQRSGRGARFPSRRASGPNPAFRGNLHARGQGFHRSQAIMALSAPQGLPRPCLMGPTHGAKAAWNTKIYKKIYQNALLGTPNVEFEIHRHFEKE